MWHGMALRGVMGFYLGDVMDGAGGMEAFYERDRWGELDMEDHGISLWVTRLWHGWPWNIYRHRLRGHSVGLLFKAIYFRFTASLGLDRWTWSRVGVEYHIASPVFTSGSHILLFLHFCSAWEILFH